MCFIVYCSHIIYFFNMNYKIFFEQNINVDNIEVEIVERKGIGHPDSLADIIAESFSNVYSHYTLKKYNTILNHWFDKVLLSGGEAILKPGSSDIVKKPKVYLFGKVTKVLNEDIPVKKLFTETVFRVFNSIFGISRELMPDIIIDVNSGVGADHLHNFYKFNGKNKNKDSPNIPYANDTVFCNGYAPRSKLESYVCELENYINSKIFKKRYLYTGYDVKVLAQRVGKKIEVTICIPFIAKKTKSWNFYENSKKIILKDLYRFTKKFEWEDFSINLNTKDHKNMGYLTVYGTALDKGDFGVVGRGNRFSGFISANRGETQEAYHGKNPVLHSGKIYSVITQRIAKKIYEIMKIPVKVSISIDNGSNLKKPEHVYIFFDTKNIDNKLDFDFIDQLLRDEFKNINLLSKKIIMVDPVREFKSREIINKK